MSYYFKTVLQSNFADSIVKTKEALQLEGFGVLTEIDMANTFKNKLDKEIAPYTILGACHPASAYEAVGKEPLVGLMLPCNVVVRKIADDVTEVAAIDPIASMMSIQNKDLGFVASTVQSKLQRVINSLQ
jgi:uncharacterized protein (DUF302 family)